MLEHEIRFGWKKCKIMEKPPDMLKVVNLLVKVLIVSQVITQLSNFCRENLGAVVAVVGLGNVIGLNTVTKITSFLPPPHNGY